MTHKVRVLLIEDDKTLQEVTAIYLTDHGLTVTAVGTAEKGLDSIQKTPPDLVLCDLQLPGLSGLRLCEILKSSDKTASIPIILMTMYGAESDRVRGLDTGADDYIVKPFSHRELLARVQALLRRINNAGRPANRFQYKGLVIDVERREILADGQAVELRHKEYELLVLMARNAGRLLTKEFIVDAVWKDEAIVTSNTLNVHILNLRKKLGPYRDLIETVIGEGYRFMPEQAS